MEFYNQKEKAIQLIPGADVKTFLGEGDDVIQTNVESGTALASQMHEKALKVAMCATNIARAEGIPMIVYY